MATEERRRMLDLIRRNIETFGRHVYVVRGGESPRFVYTIGLKERANCELVFAGGAIFSDRTVGRILNTISQRIEAGAAPGGLEVTIESIGTFRLAPVDPDWVARLLLGALDYYDIETVTAWQVVPMDEEQRFIDIPDMSRPWSPDVQFVWRWLEGGWPYEIPQSSVALTDLDAMLGYSASEVMRWEETEWEIYSGEKPDREDDAYRVPLATLIAFDASLEPAVHLRVGRGLIREFSADGEAGDWDDWGPKG